LIVDEISPAAIAEAIVYLLNHPAEAEAMGGRGRRAVEEKYNWEREEPKFWKVYQRAFESHIGSRK
jgi:glycosyltransferase involved in cell wall biosynthesis